MVLKQLKTIKMKRNEKRIPGFDEIIFGNRNRNYGAYDLRKRYKSATSISILGTVVISTLVITLLSVKPHKITASTGPETSVILIVDDFIPEPIRYHEPEMPKEMLAQTANIAPVVTADTTEITSIIPSVEELIITTENRDVNDTVVYEEQTEPDIPPEPQIFIKVEEDPEFPGGEKALLEFIGRNTVYPSEAIDNNVEGRVFLKFVVNPDGSVGRIEILKGVDHLLDKEAIRVISTLPGFRPGKQGGVPVPVWYSVPVLFRLEKR